MSDYDPVVGHFSLSAPEEKKCKHFTAKPATLALGAYISDIDLSEPLDGKIYDEIADALWHYSVLFFRDQNLTPEGHIALARHFGQLEEHEVFTPDVEHPEISILENDGSKAPEVNRWHSDVTHREKPSLCSILYGEQVPDAGGDTLWLSQRVAYETLSEPWKEFLLGLEAEHDLLRAYSGTSMLHRAGGDEKVAEIKRDHPPMIHPVVIAHPVTGKLGLFVNESYCTKIVGMRSLESDAILQMLFAHQLRVEFRLQFKWEPGSIAIWDNFSTQHYASADYFPMHRRMRRMTVAGSKPVAARPRGKTRAKAA
jgi:taurine dioxygenase